MVFKQILIFCITFATINWLLSLTEATISQEDKGLDLTEFCKTYGYELEEQTVTTTDGYILKLHRIPCSKYEKNCNTTGRPPVLLMHGLLGSTADYLTSKNQSLPFQLADKGYDVWMGNKRGNTFSRKHIKLNPDEDSSFWDFSYHEIGTIDIPALIDYLLEKTSFSKLTYIGMSQGTTAFFIMTSTKPEYNNKILLANLLAPVTSLKGTENPVFKWLAAIHFILEPYFKKRGYAEWFGNSSVPTAIVRKICLSSNIIGQTFCDKFLLKWLVGGSDQILFELVPFHVRFTPAGSSSKQFMHYTQSRISGNFSQYDYYEDNLKVYGQPNPPQYDLSKITTPVAVYLAKKDKFLNYKRIFKDLSPIQNIALIYEIPYENFNHADFIYAKDLNKLLHNKVINTINEYNKIYFR